MSDTQRSIYLDNAATTPVDPRVVEEMLPFFTERYGNPNSLYALGRDGFRALEEARESFAGSIGAATPGEVIFTGCGTEADNAAVIGIASAAKARNKGAHVVVSAFEHHAILEPAKKLAKAGFEVSTVRPREDGIIHQTAEGIVLRRLPDGLTAWTSPIRLASIQRVGMPTPRSASRGRNSSRWRQCTCPICRRLSWNRTPRIPTITPGSPRCWNA